MAQIAYFQEKWRPGQANVAGLALTHGPATGG